MRREKLRRARLKRGLSQQAAAHLLGVSRNAWSRWELGTEDPYPINIGELCKFFEVKEPSELDLEPRQGRAEEIDGTTTAHLEPFPLSLDQEEIPSSHEAQNSPQLLLSEQSVKQAIFPSLFAQINSIIEAARSEETCLAPQATNVEKAMDAGRRQLMQDVLGVTGTAMIAPASLLQQFARVLAKPSTIEQYHLSALEQRTVLLWQYRADGILLPGELYSAVSRQAQHIVHLLEGSPLPSIQVRLLATASKLFTLCGALLHDLGAYKQAREYCRLAIQAATQAEQPLLEAIASTWMSFTWTYERQYQHAAHQITQSLSLLTDPNADRRTFAWTVAAAAEISAQLGNYDECCSFLDQAQASLCEQSHQQHFYLHAFGDAQLNGYQGVCYQLLYDPKNFETVKFLEQARRSLESALLDPSVSLRWRQLHRTDLARVYVRQGEIDMACGLAIQVVQEVDQATVRHVFQRLGEIHHLLQPWKETSSVKSLNEALHTLGIISTQEG